jgi:hypothetical protein
VVSNQVIGFLHAIEVTLITGPIRHALTAFHEVLRDSPFSPEQRGKFLQKFFFRELLRAILQHLLNVLKALGTNYGRKSVRHEHPLLTRIPHLRATQFLFFAAPDVVTGILRVPQNTMHMIFTPWLPRTELYAFAV